VPTQWTRGSTTSSRGIAHLRRAACDGSSTVRRR
jgi:hypothetical protein